MTTTKLVEKGKTAHATAAALFQNIVQDAAQEMHHKETEGEISLFVRSRSIRMYNFAVEDLSNRRLLNIIKKAPQSHIDIVAPATELRCRYITAQEAQNAFHRLQDVKYSRPVRIVYDRDRLSCIVDPDGAKTNPGEIGCDQPQGKSTWTSPIVKRVLCVQNVPESLSDMELAEHFPDVVGVWRATDRQHNPKGYAYLEFRETGQCQKFLTDNPAGIVIGEAHLSIFPVEPAIDPEQVLPSEMEKGFPYYPRPRKEFYIAGEKRYRGGQFGVPRDTSRHLENRGGRGGFGFHGAKQPRYSNRRRSQSPEPAYPPPPPSVQFVGGYGVTTFSRGGESSFGS